MDWIKKNYDKAILVLALVAFATCVALVYLDFSSLDEAFSGRDSSKAPNDKIAEPPLDMLKKAAVLVKTPSEWTSHEGSLLVSRLYILKDKKLVDPLEGGDMLHPPIPNAWFIKNGIDYTRQGVLNDDPDGDGFTIIEEFHANTDPNSKASKPELTSKLRLTKFLSTPFLINFTGSPDDGDTYTVNSQNVTVTQFLKVGDMIDAGKDKSGKPIKAIYKILSHEKKSTVRNEIEVDVSELVIENTETKQKITLVANVRTSDPSSAAEFSYRLNNSTFTVKKDDEFFLPPDKNILYKVIDIKDTEAIIQNTTTGQQTKIPRG